MSFSTTYAIADALQVPLQTDKVNTEAVTHVAGGVEFPWTLKVEFIACTAAMSSVVIHFAGDLWGYLVAIEKAGASNVKMVLILFNGAGQTFKSLRKSTVVETYEGIRPLKVAYLDFNATTKTWVPHVD